MGLELYVSDRKAKFYKSLFFSESVNYFTNFDACKSTDSLSGSLLCFSTQQQRATCSVTCRMQLNNKCRTYWRHCCHGNTTNGCYSSAGSCIVQNPAFETSHGVCNLVSNARPLTRPLSPCGTATVGLRDPDVMYGKAIRNFRSGIGAVWNPGNFKRLWFDKQEVKVIWQKAPHGGAFPG